MVERVRPGSELERVPDDLRARRVTKLGEGLAPLRAVPTQRTGQHRSSAVPILATPPAADRDGPHTVPQCSRTQGSACASGCHGFVSPWKITTLAFAGSSLPRIWCLNE